MLGFLLTLIWALATTIFVMLMRQCGDTAHLRAWAFSMSAATATILFVLHDGMLRVIVGGG